MRVKLGRGLVTIAVALLGTLASPSPAHAQTYDFATCDPAAVASTVCSASTTSCCHQDASVGSSFLTSGGQNALIVPLDRCHQRPGTSTEGNPDDTTGAAPYWCSKPMGGGDDGMFLAYGLIYRLLQTQALGGTDAIPVYWVVNPSKDPPALDASQNVNTQTYITTDIDVWVLSSGSATIPAAGSALTALGTDSVPVKHVTLSNGNLSVDSTGTYGYDKQQFPIRGGAFLIAAADRAKFEKFIKRQSPYDSTNLPVQGRTGCNGGTAACTDFSAVDMYEIQPTARLAWTNFASSTDYLGQLPQAVKLDYLPPRIARVDGGAVSQLWLKKAGLNDASAASCKTGPLSPSDSVYCTVTTTDITNGYLVAPARFGWLWLDSATTSCGAGADMWTATRTFLTQQAGVRAAGNALLVDSPIAVNEDCSGKQLLGAEVSGWGLNTTGASTWTNSTPFIVRYPQNLYAQYGDLPTDFSSSSQKGFLYYGSGANGYNPLFTSASPATLHRLITQDVSSGSNTYCTNHKSSATCDLDAGANRDAQDLAAYGRFQNDQNNGIVFYLPGNQVSNHSSQLRMVLNALLATPLATVPVSSTIYEVSRSSPVVATIDNQQALVQGTYEVKVPTPFVPTLGADADAAAFSFPYKQGHMRAIPTTTGLNTTFSTASAIFDAADHIPPAAASSGGCGTWFTSSCRTVFTTTASGANPAITYLDSSTTTANGTVGTLMGSNLTTASRQTLLSRVLAGYFDGTSYVPRLGGVDRSTVAVIEQSSVAGGIRPKMAYFGASDGMLHAVCASVQTGTGCDVIGRELWAYVPRTQLPNLRYNTAYIEGSPRVLDAFGDFDADGVREWRTVLIFQTGSGDFSSSDTVPAVYALDITDPTAPSVLWEYSVTNVASRGTYELGVGLTVAAGVVQIDAVNRNVVYAQTNNGGTGSAASVVTALDLETGSTVWSTPHVTYAYPNPPRGVSGDSPIPVSGIPGGVVGVDKAGSGLLTDLIYTDLYGDLWMIDPATGTNRYGSVPLFSFSSNYHGIGGKPAVYSLGGTQYAVFVSGGFADPSDANWGSGVQQYVMSVSLSTPVADAPLSEASSAPNIGFKYTLGSTSEKGYSQVLVVGNEVFFTTDSADVNSSTYGTTGAASGKFYGLNLSGGLTQSDTTLVSGVSSIANNGQELYASGGTSAKYEGASAGAPGSGTSVDPSQPNKVTRKLWLRTE